MPLRPWQLNQQRAKPSIGYVLITGGGVANNDQVGIAGRLYEFDTDAPPGVFTGDVRVGVSGGEGGAGAANSIVALVAAINGDASRVVDALDAGGNCCVLVHRTPGVAGNVALTNPVDGGGTIAISGATLTDGADEGLLSLHADSYALTAQDVTTLAVTLGTSEIVIGAFPSTTQPLLFSLRARTGNTVRDLTDAIVQFRQVNTNQWALVYAEPAAGALLAAADVIEFLCGVTGV